MKKVASIIFAAGKGTRMTGYGGNKTLLPLIPADSQFEGKRPLLEEVLDNLPEGPRAIVVNHKAEDVRSATRVSGAQYVYQRETNGTGGALLAARDFLSSSDAEFTLITMGDVPLIGRSTYRRLLEMLDRRELAVLAFESADRAQYGMLEMEGDRVARIVEWKYWSDPRVFSVERRDGLRYCNAGVYAVRRAVLLRYMQSLQERPHIVRKMRNGVESVVEEFFLTDLVEMMHDDGLSVGAAVTAEEEVIGVDTPESLARVQALYAANHKDLRK